MNTAMPHILVVEDNPNDAELVTMAHAFNKSVSTLRIVRDGIEALDILLGEGGGLPQLVLLDLHSARLSGYVVLERLRADERTRLLPVVVFSSSAEEPEIRESMRLGASAYLQKPAGFMNLCETLAQLERDWVK